MASQVQRPEALANNPAPALRHSTAALYTSPVPIRNFRAVRGRSCTRASVPATGPCAGYLPEERGMAFELVQKAATPDIRLGSGFRHFSVSVRSIEGALQRAMYGGLDIVEGTQWEAGEVYIKVRPRVET
jgi:hypothetical protein